MNAEVVSHNRVIKLKDAAIELQMSTDYIVENLITNRKVEAWKEGSRWVISLPSWQAYLAGRNRAAA